VRVSAARIKLLLAAAKRELSAAEGGAGAAVQRQAERLLKDRRLRFSDRAVEFGVSEAELHSRR
jgi:hypothetical protein